jgi:hypothetical protein
MFSSFCSVEASLKLAEPVTTSDRIVTQRIDQQELGVNELDVGVQSGQRLAQPAIERVGGDTVADGEPVLDPLPQHEHRLLGRGPVGLLHAGAEQLVEQRIPQLRLSGVVDVEETPC